MVLTAIAATTSGSGWDIDSAGRVATSRGPSQTARDLECSRKAESTWASEWVGSERNTRPLDCRSRIAGGYWTTRWKSVKMLWTEQRASYSRPS